MRLYPRTVSVNLTSGHVFTAHSQFAQPPAANYSVNVTHCTLEGNARTLHDALLTDATNVALHKDDFAVIRVHVIVPGATFEIDALERLASLQLLVAWGAESSTVLTAEFREKVLWHMYERLSGGCWVRANPMANF